MIGNEATFHKSQLTPKLTASGHWKICRQDILIKQCFLNYCIGMTHREGISLDINVSFFSSFNF